MEANAAIQMLLLLGPAAPLVAAVYVEATKASRVPALIAAATLPALALALAVPEASFVELEWMLLGIHLGLDPLGEIFLLLTSLLWLLASVYARGYIQSNVKSFGICFTLAMAGNIGLVLAQDAPTFYLFFALMSFASYGLVIHRHDASALRAGRVYMVLVIVGEVMVFSGMVLAAHAADGLRIADLAAAIPNSPMRDLIIALLFFGFGAKAGALPLHVWLPLAHPAAPTPASAVLSGAMIKAGLIGWLRFLPLGTVYSPEWGGLIIALGFGAAFGAALVGVMQSHPKTVLAYSSISQMGLITVLVGVAFLDPEESGGIVTVVALMALHHAFSKSALFLSTGLPFVLSRRRLLGSVGLLLPALALCGFPFTSGFIAKSLLKKAASVVELSGAHALVVPALMASGVATALLMARFFIVLQRNGHAGSGVPSSMVAAWAGNVVLVLAMPLWLFVGGGVDGLAKLFSVSGLAASVWPVPLALLLSIPFVRGTLTPPRHPIPAGDLLGPMVWMLAKLADAALGVGRVLTGLQVRIQQLAMRVVLGISRGVVALQLREHRLNEWPTFGTLFMGLLLGLYWLLRP